MSNDLRADVTELVRSHAPEGTPELVILQVIEDEYNRRFDDAVRALHDLIA